MEASAYREWTAALVQRLSQDERVAGAVALGSMAGQDYAPDEWSDHDFFVITRTGAQEQLRTDLSWIPHADQIALSLRETAHGLKVLYKSGHLLEFAVFDLDELRLARINRYRVLFDKGGVAERLREVAEVSAKQAADAVRDDRWLVGQLVTQILVGGGRARRGEVLAGTAVLAGATRLFLQLVCKYVPAENHRVLDNLDPHRRIERAYPLLAQEIAAAQRNGPRVLALELIRLARRELKPRMPEFPTDAFDVVERRLAVAAAPRAR